MGPRVSVVVVSYRTRDLTLTCLESMPPRDDVEIVVIDNASGDGTAEAVRAARPDVQVIDNERNVGYARAVNQGANATSGDYILLVNPDGVVRPGTIEGMVAWADAHPECGLYGGPVFRDGGRHALPAARALPSLWELLWFGLGLSLFLRRSHGPEVTPLSRWDRTTPRRVGMLTGALLLARRDVWEALGGFDERYFVYGEDADLGDRAAAAGWAPTYVPVGGLDHEVGASADSVVGTVLLLAGKVTYLRTRWSGLRSVAGRLLLQLGVFNRALAERLTGRDRPPLWREVWVRRREWRAGFGPSGEFPWTDRSRAAA